MSEVAIRVENLSKRFRRAGAGAPYFSLRDSIARAVRSPFRRSQDEWFWSLKDVSMEIRRAEVVGIIGRNGAGKSTLLKILSRILRPTSGRAEIHGRVGSLLEVGTGFHYELSGRENLYLYGAILGMKRDEIAAKYDQIVEFAGVGAAIDTPLKHFSSGMQMRLAFAVAAFLDPEVLLVDEVLAVGDGEFQRRCIGRMHDVSKGGRTVVFVSHQMSHLRRLCDRVYWLEEGQVKMHGPAEEVISAYEAAITSGGLSAPSTDSHSLSFLDWGLRTNEDVGETLSSNGPATFEFLVETRRSIHKGLLLIILRSKDGDRLWSVWQDGLELPKGSTRLRYTVPMMPLMPGAYQWQLRFHDEHRWTEWWWPTRMLRVDTRPIAQHSDEYAALLNIPWEFSCERVK